MEKILDIDLGTTNSVIAVIEGSTPVVIPNLEGLRTTPSVVAYTKKGKLLIGNLAKRQAVVNPDNTFYSVKRFIGRNPKELCDDLKQLSYKLVESIGKFKINWGGLMFNVNKALLLTEVFLLRHKWVLPVAIVFILVLPTALNILEIYCLVVWKF
jgi:hypothetical protein